MKNKRLSRIIKAIVISAVIGLTMQMFSCQVSANPTTGPSTTGTTGAGGTTSTTGTGTSGGSTSTSTTTSTTTTTTTGTSDKKSINDILNAGKNWLEGEQENKPAGTEVEDFVDKLIGIGQALVAIGIVTVLIVTTITAIKWITATPDKQAKLKEQLIGLVVATIVIFGAVGIWSIVRGIMENVEEKISEAPTKSIVVVAKK